MFKFTKPVTPAEITTRMRELIDELVPRANPEYIEVSPLVNVDADDCFKIVADQVETHGGNLIVGWALWEWPKTLVEAEFHCVWKQPNGELLDIAPKSDPTEAVLFLHDASRVYEGRQVDNLRKSVSRDPIVDQYIETFEAKFELLNRGRRATQYGKIQLIGSEAQEFNGIISAQKCLHLEILKKTPRASPYFPCPCGSGKKIRWCHDAIILNS